MTMLESWHADDRYIDFGGRDVKHSIDQNEDEVKRVKSDVFHGLDGAVSMSEKAEIWSNQPRFEWFYLISNINSS
jgi:hypothetical protein